MKQRPDGSLPRKDRVGKNWFRTLFGFDETIYEETQMWLHVEGDTLYSHGNNTSYKIGSFETPSLEKLRESVLMNKDVNRVMKKGGLKLSAVKGDVQLFLANKTNMYATFQVASQFNCLEFIAPSYVPEDGITGYVRDRTQGPACSIACGPATAYRNYFAPVNTAKGKVRIGQTEDHMIDNLCDFSHLIGNDPKNPFFTVEGGYTMASADGLQRLNKGPLQNPLDEKLLGSIRIGVHTDIQVTSSNWGRVNVADENIIVAQVFCSACAVNYNSGSSVSEWENLSRCVLYSAYESTLLAAILNAYNHKGSHASKRVYLTLLGGGVFGNPDEWILDAIRRACEKLIDYDLDVKIIAYGGVPENIQQLVKNFDAQVFPQ
eukprot:CAMPEP_0204861008 /NCGR_PEP_ID=MMETSP1348-20121228/1108_1 /ASSEMBLY_ACC=CAM_ASM_000700 /TAXON_ID=215587 /ORGANISM="Aplanochytrium stocchinoi, Strain GSBS06" /LENGTH=375 /DNA_ID=CAMNT_0052010123 /DNA_START=139 /DNA_END=1266 /DNA_ORIENTATION=-